MRAQEPKPAVRDMRNLPRSLIRTDVEFDKLLFTVASEPCDRLSLCVLCVYYASAEPEHADR